MVCIGSGTCGEVWTNSSPEGSPGIAIKFETPKGAHDGDGLFAPIGGHSRLSEAMARREDDLGEQFSIRVPRLAENAFEDDAIVAFLCKQVAAFEENGINAYSILFTERINSFPKSVKKALIKHFCPGPFHLLAACLRRKARDHCMIRPCLGKTTSTGPTITGPGFSLRDLELDATQLASIGVDPRRVARIMGEACATLFWLGGQDGRGIDFVLAPDRAAAAADPRDTISSHVLGDHVALWMLDFDESAGMGMDDAGMRRAVRAFLGSGRDGRPAYFPMPPGAGEESCNPLWLVFRNAFYFKSMSVMSVTGDVRDAYWAMEFTEMVERLTAEPAEELEKFLESS
jgi:hypothetical protein